MKHWKIPALFSGMVLVVLGGCGAGAEKAVEMRVNFAGNGNGLSPTLYSANGGSFYDNGFPTGLRLKNDGRIDLSDFPRPFQLVTQRYVNGIESQLPTRGYHTISPIYIPLTGPVATRQLPANPLAYTDEDAAVQVVDIDPRSPDYGRRFPLSVTQTTVVDSFRPDNLLQVLPTLGVSLRPNTTYAAFLTDQLPMASGYVLQQNEQLASALLPEIAENEVPEKVLTLFSPLRDYLARQRIDPAVIMAATVWQTGDPTAALRRGAQSVAAMPLAPVTGLELVQDFADYCVIRGYVDTPGFQNGTVPYLLTGGRIEWAANSVPIQKYSRNAEFIVTIPNHRVMPDQGFPLMEYHHGAGGSAEQVYIRGDYRGNGQQLGNGPSQIAAERGWASSGFAGHLGTDHAGPILGYGLVPYNLENPVSMFNSYYQMVWERIYFRRVLNRMRIPQEMCPQAILSAGEEYFRFDARQRVVMGQSLGNWTASLQLVADPDPFQGAILTGVAGTWIKLFANQPEMKLAVATLLPNLLPTENLDDMHPFLMLMEWLLGGADPVAYLDNVLKYPNKTAPHVLVISGLDDQGGREPVQWPHLMSLGVDLAGPDLGNSYDTTLFPHLAIAGAQQRAYPVRDNVTVPQQGKRTAVVVRYENTVRPDHNGHHVAFDLEAPKHQYGCFLQYLSWQQSPLVFEGGLQGEACP